jgi:hypothetical protein
MAAGSVADVVRRAATGYENAASTFDQKKKALADGERHARCRSALRAAPVERIGSRSEKTRGVHPEPTQVAAHPCPTIEKEDQHALGRRHHGHHVGGARRHIHLRKREAAICAPRYN